MRCATEISLIVIRQVIDKSLHVPDRYRIVANRFWNEISDNGIRLYDSVVNAFVTGTVGDVQFGRNQLTRHWIQSVAREACVIKNV